MSRDFVYILKRFELQFELRSFTAITTYQQWSIAISPSARIIAQRPAPLNVCFLYHQLHFLTMFLGSY